MPNKIELNVDITNIEPAATKQNISGYKSSVGKFLNILSGMFEPQNGLINYYNQPNHWTMTPKVFSKNEDVCLYHNQTKYFFYPRVQNLWKVESKMLCPGRLTQIMCMMFNPVTL